MAQTGNKQSRQAYISNESNQLELEKQKQRAKHKKVLHEFFKPRVIKFIKT